MRWNKSNILLSIAIISLLVACVPSEQVVSNHFLTKRKYTKGWYIHSHTNEKKTVARHIQTEETAEIKSIEKDNFSDNQSALVYAQADEQMLLPEKKLQSNTYIPETNSLAEKTDTIPAKKKVKKIFFSSEKNESKKDKKTNPPALVSFILALVSYMLIGLSMLLKSGATGYLMSFMFVISSTFSLFSGYFAFLALELKRKEPDKYKNFGLIFPGLLPASVAAIAQIFIVGIVFLFTVFGVYQYGEILALLIPSLLLVLFELLLRYIKKQKELKKNGVERQPLTDGMKRRKRAGILFMLFSLLLIITMLISPFTFSNMLFFRADFYLFLFACGVFLIGLVLKLTSMHVFAKKNKE
jgi:hypothetical protein